MKESIHIKRVLAFVLLLALPSLVLSYFAIRGILGDRAGAEQELLDQHRGALQTIVSTIEGQLLSHEAPLKRIGIEATKGNWNEARVLARQLQPSGLMLEIPFILQPHSKPSYFGISPLFSSDSSSTVAAAIPLLEESLSDSSAFYEYQVHDYAKALTIYKRALQSTTNPVREAHILFAVTRIQKRLSMQPQAVQTVNTLVRKFGHVRTECGLPVGFVARTELVELEIEQSEFEAAAHGIEMLFDDLLQGTWQLRRPEFEFAVAQLTRLRTILPSGALKNADAFNRRFDRHEQDYNTRRGVSDEILIFEKVVAPMMIDSFARPGKPNRLLRMFHVADSQTVCLLAIRALGPRSVSAPIVGVLLSQEALTAIRLTDLLRQVPLPPQSSLQILNERGELIAGSAVQAGAHQTVQAGFPLGVPPWTLALYHQEPSTLDEILYSRRSVYFFTILLAFSVLTVGGTLFWRVVTKELALSRLQSEFVTLVSHELRSPLTSIRQLSELLQAGRLPSEERRRQYYDTLVEQVVSLSQLVENILGVTRLEQGDAKLNFESVDARKLLEGLAIHLKHRFEHNGFSLDFVVDQDIPMLSLDRVAITDAITNIIDNAVKYSGSSKSVDVLVHRCDDHVCIVIRDHGLGIKRSELKNIFTKFYRADDPQVRAMRGTGLGLSLANSIVEQHGGKLLVESEYGAGSAFTIRLPIPQQNGI